ncbi:MAG: PstS family phosphate ABC transporter substrate-binding protein [Cyanobacteria bacterium J06639_14]
MLIAVTLTASCGGPPVESEAPIAEQVSETETPVQVAPPEVEEEIIVAPIPEPLVEEDVQVPVGSVSLPEVDPLDVEGDISVAGSSTVFPLSRAIHDRFIQHGYAGRIKLDSIGSGAGFRLFCQEGVTDIANASRPIKEEEVTACQSIGRQPIEFRVGTDALAIVVNPENDFVNDVTSEELAALFSAEKWSDVKPEWPNEPIERFVPGEESGTFDFFIEEALGEDEAKLLNAPNTEFSEDDTYIQQSIAANPNAIGFFGYAYYEENKDALKIIAVEGVAPSAEAVEGDEYFLARPLLIYSDAAIIRAKPQVGALINFYLSNVNRVIEGVGYFPSSPQVLDQSEAKLLQVTR